MKKRDVSLYAWALALALEIEAFWRERGYPKAKAWVVPAVQPHLLDPDQRGTGRGTVWGVRSNLVDGMPPL